MFTVKYCVRNYPEKTEKSRRRIRLIGLFWFCGSAGRRSRSADCHSPPPTRPSQGGQYRSFPLPLSLFFAVNWARLPSRIPLSPSLSCIPKLELKLLPLLFPIHLDYFGDFQKTSLVQEKAKNAWPEWPFWGHAKISSNACLKKFEILKSGHANDDFKCCFHGAGTM